MIYMDMEKFDTLHLCHSNIEKQSPDEERRSGYTPVGSLVGKDLLIWNFCWFVFLLLHFDFVFVLFFFFYWFIYLNINWLHGFIVLQLFVDFFYLESIWRHFIFTCLPEITIITLFDVLLCIDVSVCIISFHTSILILKMFV